MITVILTGGKSRRMGRDKALLEMDGGVMSLVLARRYAQLGTVVFSVDRANRFEHGSFPELYDAFPGQGPLNGLYSVFHAYDTEYAFLTATDMPNGDPALAEYLLSQIGDCMACTIQRRDGYLEPLFTVYHRSCLPRVEQLLKQGRNSLMNLLREDNVRKIPEESLPQWDLDSVLSNLNTPQEYKRFKAV